MRNPILTAKVNTIIGSIFVFSFGLFVVSTGLRIVHMADPITSAISQEMAVQ
jgi:Na+/H+ antiporter NhaD/arsenite permease-like protein